MNEICELCGISRSAFYHYFDDKYSVLESICNEILEHVAEMNLNMHTIRISDTDTSMPLWIETATYISEKRDFILPLISIPGDQPFIHQWRHLIQETIKKRLLADHFKDMEKLDLISYTLAASTISLYEYWFRYQPDLSPEEIARLGSQLLWSSFYYFQKF